MAFRLAEISHGFIPVSQHALDLSDAEMSFSYKPLSLLGLSLARLQQRNGAKEPGSSVGGASVPKRTLGILDLAPRIASSIQNPKQDRRGNDSGGNVEQCHFLR